MVLAAILFAIAALGGVALAGIRISGKPLPPMALALVHGAFAASGLVALLVVVMRADAVATSTWVALGAFVVAALGGFALFSFHLRGRALPVPLVVIHGLVAVVGFVLVLVGIFALRG